MPLRQSNQRQYTQEVQLLGEYLRRRQDRPVEACRQLVWALLTSSEFRFNY